jgi:hypothetical protein
MPPVLHGTGEIRKQRWELADVFHLHGEAYRQSHPVSSSELKVMRAIEQCRTEALGGHLEKCDQCGFERPCYNSCRNRHCPKCQYLTKARWLEARTSELLPVPYFHVVFTLPHEVNPLARFHKKQVYDLLFQSVSKTLLQFGEKTLGGKIAATMILHTWDQKLKDHLHIHCAIPAGALSADGNRWIDARTNFLFPVKAMSVMYRGKFLDALKKIRSQFTDVPADFDKLVHTLYGKEWVVYAKPAFQGASCVLDYLGRYTHRVAISNDRILEVSEKEVTFSYRDRQDGNKKKTLTLAAEEFIRRFLLHTLPASFMKVRHIGFLANKSKKIDLARCRELLKVEETDAQAEPKTTRELFKELTGVDLDLCPCCKKGRMVIAREIPKKGWDSS